MSRALLYVTMRPPSIAPAIAFSPGRLLGAAILLAVVVLLALMVAWRRARAADAVANEPLKRLNGFHIFGPDEDDEDRAVHVPVLRARPATNGSAPSQRRPAPGASTSTRSVPARAASRAPLTSPPPPSARRPHVAATLAPAKPAAATAARRPAAEPLVAWNQPRSQANGATHANGTASPPPPPRREHREQREHRELVGTPAATAIPTPRQRLAPGQELPRDGDILLVEDDVAIAGMYQMLLTTRGYAARHALDGVEGIAMVRKQRPALILLDMMMPRMDGLQFLEALRGWPKTRDIPVVILSNVGDRHLVDKALSLGAVEYLVKAQTRPQVLIGALPHWLRGNRALTTLS